MINVVSINILFSWDTIVCFITIHKFVRWTFQFLSLNGPASHCSDTLFISFESTEVFEYPIFFVICRITLFHFQLYCLTSELL